MEILRRGVVKDSANTRDRKHHKNLYSKKLEVEEQVEVKHSSPIRKLLSGGAFRIQGDLLFEFLPEEYRKGNRTTANLVSDEIVEFLNNANDVANSDAYVVSAEEFAAQSAGVYAAA